MHTEVRMALIVLALAGAAVMGWLAWSRITGNVVVLRSWKRVPGVVRAMPQRDYIEVEIGEEPDARRVAVTADHMVGLSFLGRVDLYQSPGAPERFRLGGILQMWLFPSVLVLGTMVSLLCLAGATKIGRGEVAGEGRWMMSATPSGPSGEILLRSPREAVLAPLFWSLLGVAALTMGVLARGAGPMQRMGLILAGAVFLVATWALSWHNRTLRFSAGRAGVRETSAFGWREFRWEQVASVERRRVVPTDYVSFHSAPLPFPGQTTETIVFADREGRTLMRTSTNLQPGEARGQLFDLCAARTGLIEQLRTIRVPTL